MQVLLQYQSKSYYIIGQEVYYSIGRFYYIIGQLLHYRAFFITLSGTYYSIGHLLHDRLVQQWLYLEWDVVSENGCPVLECCASDVDQRNQGTIYTDIHIRKQGILLIKLS